MFVRYYKVHNPASGEFQFITANCSTRHLPQTGDGMSPESCPNNVNISYLVNFRYFTNEQIIIKMVIHSTIVVEFGIFKRVFIKFTQLPCSTVHSGTQNIRVVFND